VPLLLPGPIRIQGKDRCVDLSDPVPASASAMHTKDGHDAWHTRGPQRQRINGPFTDPQRAGASVACRSIAVTLRAG
jgi:hypothetical protein